MRDHDPVLSALAAANPVPRDLAARLAASYEIDPGPTASFDSGRPSRLLQPRGGRRLARPLAFVVLVVLIGVGSALALRYRPSVDFFSAKKGPAWAFASFERNPKITELFQGRKRRPAVELTAPARQITDVRYDGRSHLLVVAPTRGGGYCFSWRGPYLSADCVRTRDPNTIEAHLPGDQSGPIALYGTFQHKDGNTLELLYQDGTTDEIPAVWVSDPIGAGFFLYKIPAANRIHGHAPATLSLLDSNGHALTRKHLPIVNR